jgi:hypothetical protein
MTLEFITSIVCIIVAIALMWLALPGKRLNAWLLRKPVAEASYPILALVSFVVGLLLCFNAIL